jgi:hypothetical protein
MAQFCVKRQRISMTSNLGIFPFGQPVQRVEQKDRSPKKVFVLGVYASAVHARWVGPDGKLVSQALAVASEPCIFWKGDGAADIIKRVVIPAGLGKLEPAAKTLNGPSGNELDNKFLGPLEFNRQDAWLCDLVPCSGCNDRQKKAIKRAYLPAMQEYNLPLPTVPDAPKDGKITVARRQEILDELRQSQAPLLILLGDQPIKWFLRHFDKRWERLSDFGPYGEKHKVSLDGLEVEVLPLCHPRQAGRLGPSSKEWYDKHGEWVGKCKARKDSTNAA